MFLKKLKGYRDFGNGRIVYDEDCYQLILKHSRLIDRLDPRKLINMYEIAHGILDGDLGIPKNRNWMFYGKGDQAPKW